MQLYMIYMSKCVYIYKRRVYIMLCKQGAHARTVQCSGNSRDSNLIIQYMRDKLDLENQINVQNRKRARQRASVRNKVDRSYP